MKNKAKYKKRLSQQLVEFLLVVPFLVIILGIVTEYAYALSINMTLQKGLRDVTSSVYKTIQPGLTLGLVKTKVYDDLNKYLRANNIATSYSTGGNALELHTIVNGDTTVFLASLRYVAAFSLPTVYFKFLPDEFNFTAGVAVPTAFLKGNKAYLTSPYTSTQLDNIWGASSFGSQDDFTATKKGVMKSDTPAGSRAKMVFLVPTIQAEMPSTPYKLVKWDGTEINSQYRLSTSNGHIYECITNILLGTTTCTDIGAFNAIINGYTNILFAQSDSTWLSPGGTSDLSPMSVQGELKKTLALIDGSSKSVGNYDNLDVQGSSYRPDISTSRPYKIEATSGGKIFVHNLSQTDIDKLK